MCLKIEQLPDLNIKHYLFRPTYILSFNTLFSHKIKLSDMISYSSLKTKFDSSFNVSSLHYEVHSACLLGITKLIQCDFFALRSSFNVSSLHYEVRSTCLLCITKFIQRVFFALRSSFNVSSLHYEVHSTCTSLHYEVHSTCLLCITKFIQRVLLCITSSIAYTASALYANTSNKDFFNTENRLDILFKLYHLHK